MENNQEKLEKLLEPIRLFLEENLNLKLHPDKIVIKKHSQGIDFLGLVALPHYRLLRTKTKRRAFKKLKTRVKEYKIGKTDEQALNQTLQSYLGVLTHANTHKLSRELLNQFWFWLSD